MYRLITFLLLMGTWTVFSGVLDAYHLGLGVVCCAFVAWLSTDLLFQEQEKGLGDRVAEVGRFLHYGGWLMWQIVLANWHVLKLALFKKKEELDPHVIRFKTCLQSEFARYVFANSITLTPGTVTIDIEKDLFIVHAIDTTVAAELPGEMEQRVAAVFQEEQCNLPEEKGDWG